MGGSTSGGGVSTVRYAEYVEKYHWDFLAAAQGYRIILTVSPPFALDYIEIDEGFFGASYAINSFPSLYDMFGKFMAGLDIDTLYSQVFEDTVNAPEINDLVAAESSLLDDELENVAYPRMKLGHRDINSVISSTFEIDKAILEGKKQKLVERFSAELKYRMIPVVTQRWQTHLTWNEKVVLDYAHLMKFWISAKMDVDQFNWEMSAKQKLWPFTVIEYERACIGAMQGAITTTKDVAGTSHVQKAIGGALSGAATGAMIGAEVGEVGGPLGAAIGGVLGAASGLF